MNFYASLMLTSIDIWDNYIKKKKIPEIWPKGPFGYTWKLKLKTENIVAK